MKVSLSKTQFVQLLGATLDSSIALRSQLVSEQSSRDFLGESVELLKAELIGVERQLDARTDALFEARQYIQQLEQRCYAHEESITSLEEQLEEARGWVQPASAGAITRLNDALEGAEAELEDLRAENAALTRQLAIQRIKRYENGVCKRGNN